MADRPPQDVVALDFMRRKGYPRIQPIDVDKLEGQPCWYYRFEIDEGTIELEVFWDGEEWETAVCTFKVAN
jgi:hypothetical protein